MADITTAGLNVKEQDGSGNSLTSTTSGLKQALDVNIATALPAGTNSLGKVTALLTDGSGNSIGSYNSQLAVEDIVNTSLSSGSITVSTTAVAARVSSSNLTNRKQLTIAPTTGTVYLGGSSGVTTATGIPIFQNQVISFSFGASVTPYLIAASSQTVNIIEGA